MNVLITGANGQIAYELIRLADPLKFKVIPLSKELLDVTDFTQVQTALVKYNPSVVINAAAFTKVDQAEDDKDLAFAVNAHGAKNIALSCENLQVPLLHLSTDFVFDGNKQQPYLETDLPLPLNVYGLSKKLGEDYIREYCERHLILRVSGVFGFHGHNFVKTIIRLIQTRRSLDVVGDQFTAPTSATSIAKILLQLCSAVKNNPAWGIYHYRNDKVLSWAEFAKKIIFLHHKTQNPAMVREVSTQEYPLKAIRPLYPILCINKIKEVFGIETASLEAELINVVEELSVYAKN